MRTSAAAACVAILAVAVPLARADVGDPDYEEPTAATAQTEPDYETSDYVDLPLPEVAVDPATPMPEMTVDAVAPGPIPTMAPTPADGPTPSAVEPAGPPMEVDEMVCTICGRFCAACGMSDAFVTQAAVHMHAHRARIAGRRAP